MRSRTCSKSTSALSACEGSFIDCALCVPECPVEAIYDESDLPSDLRHYVALNAELAVTWQPIADKKEALPEADSWSGIKDKFALLERE